MQEIDTLPTSQVVLHPTPVAIKPRRELLTLIPDTTDEYLMVIDNSSFEYFTTCPRSAYWNLVCTRKAHARNASLTFGGAVHVGWEHIEKSEGKPVHDISLSRVWTDVDTAQEVLRYFTENPTPPDEYRTPTCALELLAHYRVRKHMPDYSWTVLSDSHGLLVERPFELPLGVIEVGADIQLPTWKAPRFVSFVHVAWSGRIDIVVNANEKNRVGDNKTTSIAGDQFVQDFQLSNGVIGYVWAGQKLWPDLNPTGFVLNAAHLKKHKPGTPLMDRGPRGGEPPLNFFRAYFDYSPERITQWEHNAITIVSDFITCLVRNEFPLHTKWCFNKYGKCQYHDVCTQDNPEVQKRFLMSDAFTDVTWDPTHDR